MSSLIRKYKFFPKIFGTIFNTQTSVNNMQKQPTLSSASRLPYSPEDLGTTPQNATTTRSKRPTSKEPVERLFRQISLRSTHNIKGLGSTNPAESADQQNAESQSARDLVSRTCAAYLSPIRTIKVLPVCPFNLNLLIVDPYTCSFITPSYQVSLPTVMEATL